MGGARRFHVRRDDFRRHVLADGPGAELEDRQCRVAVDRFALTANNVSYAVFGERLRYWDFFPAEDGWGCVPVWGFGNVTESRAEGIQPGERLFGYWPMGTEAVLTPGRVTDLNVFDHSPHRRELPAAYQVYQRTAGNPAHEPAGEDLQALLWPLFITSFLAEDFLADQFFFGAKQVVLGCASSKTAAGVAHLLARREGHPVKVVGLTSDKNVSFVRGIGDCDLVLPYGKVTELDASVPAVWVDMAGNGQLLHDIHHHFGDALRYSCLIGSTHWEARQMQDDLPGAKPTFFFAPTQYQKRHQDWGPGGVEKRFARAWVGFRPAASEWLKVEARSGAESMAQTWLEVLEGRTAPDRGYILSF